MALFEFKLPDIGEGVTEGEIVEWHVKAGDAVVEDQPMVEVMTDKATVTIGAPKQGVIAELRYAVGAIAKVGSVLVAIDTAGAGGPYREASAPSKPASATAPTPPASKRDDGPAATAVGDIREGLDVLGGCKVAGADQDRTGFSHVGHRVLLLSQGVKQLAAPDQPVREQVEPLVPSGRVLVLRECVNRARG